MENTINKIDFHSENDGKHFFFQWKGEEFKCGYREWNILRYLYENMEELCTYDDLIEEGMICRNKADLALRIYRLRSLFIKSEIKDLYIDTIYSKGYILKNKEDQ